MRAIGYGVLGVWVAVAASACSNGSGASAAAGGSSGSSEVALAGASGADDSAPTDGGTGGRASNNDAGRGASVGNPSEGGHAGLPGGGRSGTSGGGGSSSSGAGSAGRAGAAGNGGSGTAGSAGTAGAATQPTDQWLAVWGGSGVDLSGGFAISPNHVIIAAGHFGSPSIDLDPTAGVDVHQHLRPVTGGTLAKQDAFVVWLNADGSYRRGCTIPGNPGNLSYHLTVAAGADDSAIVAGPFDGTVDFDPGPGEKSITALRTGATFVLSLTSSCELSWAYQLNDAILDDYLIAAKGRPLATDSSGNIYLVGVFTQFDFDLGPGSQLQTVSQGYDSFLLKLSPSAGFVWVRRIHGGSPSVVSVSPDGKTIIVGGAYGGTIDLDPSSAEDLHTAQSQTDGYAVAFDAEGGFLWSYTHSDDATSRVELNNIVVGADGSTLLGAQNNYYFEHRAANGTPLWVWDPAYTVRSAAFAPDGRLLLLGRLYGGDPDPSKPYNPTPPFYGSEFLSLFGPDGRFVSSLAFGGQSGDTTGNQIIFDDGYAYVSGTISESPVSNYSYLPQGPQGGQGNEVSLRPNGTDDAFLFRTKLPQ